MDARRLFFMFSVFQTFLSLIAGSWGSVFWQSLYFLFYFFFIWAFIRRWVK